MVTAPPILKKIKKKTMAKVIVKANEDFFDKANNIQRTQGSEFVLREDYAKGLGKQVTIGKKFGVEDTSNAAGAKKEAPAKKETKEKAQAEPKAKNNLTKAGIEKVKKSK